TFAGFLQLAKQACSLSGEQLAPARLSCSRGHMDTSEHGTGKAPHQLKHWQMCVGACACVDKIGDIWCRSDTHDRQRRAEIAEEQRAVGGIIRTGLRKFCSARLQQMRKDRQEIDAGPSGPATSEVIKRPDHARCAEIDASLTIVRKFIQGMS